MFEHDGPLFQRLKLVLKTNDSFRGWLWLSNPLRMAVEAPVMVVTLIYDTTNENHASNK